MLALGALALGTLVWATRAHAQDVVVRGSVRGPGGVPVPQAEIIVGDSSRARTDSAGAFTVGGLAAGSVELVVRRVGFAPIAIPLTLAVGQRRTLVIELAKLPYAIDPVVVTARRPGLFGQVVDDAGHPIANADVIVAGSGRRVKTGADGGFAMPDLADRAAYMVVVRAPDHIAAQFSVALPPDHGQEVRVQLGAVDPALSRNAREVASGFWARDTAMLRNLDHRLRVNRTLLVTRADLAKRSGRSLDGLLAENLATLVALPASDRGLRSIDGRGTKSDFESVVGTIGPNRPGTCYFENGIPTMDLHWLMAADASWIESIEVTRDDITGTLRRLVGPTTRCSQYVVVWLKR